MRAGAVDADWAKDSRSGRLWSRALRHIVCILALMWTGIVNGQPFFFADSTNYIRAADIAVHMATGGAVSTVWTERYRSALPSPDGKPARPTGEAVHSPTANDVGAGLVMSGRSPYIGALMYAGWVVGWFWPFVLLQAATAYALIILTLRCFALDRSEVVLGVTLGLAALTSLPTYNSLLLADGFASFGILAVVLLALPARLTRWQTAFLVAVLVVATTAHLTHLMMLLGMLAALGLMTIVGWMRPERRVWFAGGATVLLSVLALQITAQATRLALGRQPQLLPLLTARIYMDGPGRAYIDSGCENRRFTVCRIPIAKPVNNAGWLFATDPRHGAYMLGTAEQRRRMGEEDVAFALAVVRAYPVEQVTASFLNTARQFVWINYDSLNQGCRPRPDCWENLPPIVHDRFDGTPSGRNLWPQSLMNVILHVTVIGSLIALVAAMTALRARDRNVYASLRNALLVVLTAMLVCSFFGGAVADPQYRYQGRLSWLPVLFAVIATLCARRVERSRDGSGGIAVLTASPQHG